jgi:uncharacterized protein (DUF2384 family)
MMEAQGVNDEVAEELVNRDIRKHEQAKKAMCAFKRRKTEEQGQMHSQEGESIWQTARALVDASP